MAVWERLYPDENGQLVQRWKANKTTKNLKFSHKWVIGLLKRVQAARGEGTTPLIVICNPILRELSLPAEPWPVLNMCTKSCCI